MSEHWRPCPLDTRYMISDHGRVIGVYGRQLRLQPRDADGHLGFSLATADRPVYIHRMVLLTFVGPCPNGMVVCHNDGDPTNNHIDNLRYGFPQDNTDDSKKHGTFAQGVQMPHAKLTDDVVRAIRTDNRTHRAIALDYGVSRQLISDVKRGVDYYVR